MPIPEYVATLRQHVGHAMLMLPSATAVVIDDTGRVLLERRSDTGRWALVEGIVDPGAQPAAAAVREAREETGLEIRVDRLAGVALHEHVYPNGDQCQYVNTWFRCT